MKKEALKLTYTVNPDNPSDPKGIHTYYQRIINAMPNNVYWLNRDCVTMGCNRNVLKLIGLEKLEDFVGITYNEMGRLANWTEGQAQSFRHDDMEVMSTGIAKYNYEEPPLYDEKGNPVYYMSTREPIFDDNHNVIGIVGISVDITKLKKSELELKRAKEAAETANAAKTEFIQNMRHDLITPFSGIYSMTEHLARKETDPKKKESLTAIFESAKIFLDRLKLIFGYIETEDGTIPVLDKQFDLSQLVENVIKTHVPIATIKNLEIACEIDPKTPRYVIGDEFRTNIILTNLMSNAIKFTKTGSIRIKTKAYPLGEFKAIVEFKIIDSGIGIPNSKINTIFERFNRLAPAYEGNYTGSGLGLWFVKKYLDELNGEAKVNSEPEKGSEFIVRIPYKVAMDNYIKK